MFVVFFIRIVIFRADMYHLAEKNDKLKMTSLKERISHTSIMSVLWNIKHRTNEYIIQYAT